MTWNTKAVLPWPSLGMASTLTTLPTYYLTELTRRSVCYTGSDLISRSWNMNTGSDEEPPYHTEADLAVTTIAAGVRACAVYHDTMLTEWIERRCMVYG